MYGCFEQLGNIDSPLGGFVSMFWGEVSDRKIFVGRFRPDADNAAASEVTSSCISIALSAEKHRGNNIFSDMIILCKQIAMISTIING